MKDNTKLLHGYDVLDKFTGAASIPIYQTSTFHTHDIYCKETKYQYTRFSNPTIEALESGLKFLEDAKYALSFSSGMAAISEVLMLLKPGEHIILPIDVYGGTSQFTNEILKQFDIEVTFLDMSSIDNVRKNIKENTKMLYIESPSNPLLKVSDIKALIDLSKEYNLISVVDNTFMSSLYQKPLKMGADIVVESISKFINGHSDVIAGLIATNNKEFYEKLLLYRKNFGAILGVEDAWLIMRGMKTMALRMQESIKNAEIISKFLDGHKKLKKVHYPGLKTHPNYDIQMKQAGNGGAVLSFEFETKEDMLKFLENIKIPIIAVSLGGVESILSHPATMSHACICKEERAKQGISDNLLRLSCGIENIEDLLEDFEKALDF